MKYLIELRSQRAAKIAEARKIIDKARDEKRDMSEEENKTYGDILADAQKLKDEYEREERQLQLEDEIRQSTFEKEERNIRQAGGGKPVEEEADEEADEKVVAFRNFVRFGERSMPQDERRDLQKGADDKGGYLAPDQFLNELIRFVDDNVWVRANARVIELNEGGALGVPSLDTNPADWDWTSELGTGSEDDTMRFGKRRLEPHPVAKRIKVSRDLIMSSAIDPVAEVTRALGLKFSYTEEKAYLTGSGSNQPLGVFTASNDGIPTSRDVSTGNTTTGITFDGLIGAKYGIKPQYRGRPSTAWIFHRDAMSQISKLQDGEGQYIWRPSVRENEPDVILGIPVLESEFTPSTFTTGLYVGILGDFQQYWIVEAMAMGLQRLDELYAETSQVGFIGRRRIDGMPVLSEAFARVTLA